jgi:hypothetical protein
MDGSPAFGWRAGLVAGVIVSTLGVVLQFSRETSEARPTATLWALSAAFFLEAARSGKAWASIGAGIAGVVSVNFYPSGQLCAISGVIFCLSPSLQRSERTRVTGV